MFSQHIFTSSNGESLNVSENGCLTAGHSSSFEFDEEVLELETEYALNSLLGAEIISSNMLTS